MKHPNFILMFPVSFQMRRARLRSGFTTTLGFGATATCCIRSSESQREPPDRLYVSASVHNVQFGPWFSPSPPDREVFDSSHALQRCRCPCVVRVCYTPSKNCCEDGKVYVFLHVLFWDTLTVRIVDIALSTLYVCQLCCWLVNLSRSWDSYLEPMWVIEFVHPNQLVRVSQWKCGLE